MSYWMTSLNGVCSKFKYFMCYFSTWIKIGHAIITVHMSTWSVCVSSDLNDLDYFFLFVFCFVDVIDFQQAIIIWCKWNSLSLRSYWPKHQAHVTIHAHYRRCSVATAAATTVKRKQCMCSGFDVWHVSTMTKKIANFPSFQFWYSQFLKECNMHTWHTLCSMCG